MRAFSKDRLDLAEWRSPVAAAGGLAVSTTRAFAILPRGTQAAFLKAHTFVTAVVVRIGMLPFLTILRTNDNLATAAVDETWNAQDNDVATDVVLSSFPTLANGGFVLVGAARKFRGVNIDVDAANGNASVLTVEYWNGSAWVSLAATDGTAAAGATMGQDGDVTWTIPTAWKRATLNEVGGVIAPVATTKLPPPASQEPLFWTRWSVSAALDSTTTQNAWIALAASTAFAEFITGQEQLLHVRPELGGTIGFEAIADAGTAKLIVNAAAGVGGFD